MKAETKKQKDILFLVGITLFPIIYISANLHRTSGPVLPPDEFGYWKNAAQLLGIDWSGAFFAQPYYAKGYSFLLVPLMLIFKDPHMMYKGALVVNAALFALSGMILYLLAKEIIGERKESGKVAFSLTVLAGVYYPAHFVYMNYTIAETLLYLLVVLSFLMLVRYEKTGAIRYAVIALLISLFCPVVHLRTVCIPVVMIIAIVTKCRMDRKKTDVLKAAVPLLAVFCASALAVFAIAMMKIKTGFDPLDYSLEKVCMTFSIKGIIDVILGIIGKLFYLCVSTFGLFFFWVRRVWRRRKESVTETAFFLAVILASAIASVFLISGDGVYYLVYGRYSEIFAPLIVSLGLSELTNPEEETGMGVKCTVIISLVAAVLTMYALYNEMDTYVRENVIGMSWLFGSDFPTVNMFILIPAILCIVSLWFFIWMRSRAEKDNDIAIVSATVVMAVSLFAGLFMSEVCVYDFQKIGKNDTEMFEEATKMYDDGRQVVFLRYPWSNYIGHLQFYMWDRKITFVEGLDPEAYETADSAVVVTYPDYEDPDQLLSRYDTVEKYAHFNMYYNKAK